MRSLSVLSFALVVLLLWKEVTTQVEDDEDDHRLSKRMDKSTAMSSGNASEPHPRTTRNTTDHKHFDQPQQEKTTRVSRNATTTTTTSEGEASLGRVIRESTLNSTHTHNPSRKSRQTGKVPVQNVTETLNASKANQGGQRH